MTETNYQRLRSPHWLMRKDDKVFHAYVTGILGQTSVCGKGRPIGPIAEMEIPGHRSPCCVNCVAQWFGLKFESNT